MSAQASPSTRILFVDDSKVMLKTAAKILKAEFEVITAVDGNDAWAKLEKDHDIQVLFTDINMPDCDGYELLKFVRTSDDPGLNAMPVILVTGADDDQTARQTALDRGATDFINKKSLGEELLPRARAHARYQRISRKLRAHGLDIWLIDCDGDVRPLIPHFLAGGVNTMFPWEVNGSGHPGESLASRWRRP